MAQWPAIEPLAQRARRSQACLRCAFVPGAMFVSACFCLCSWICRMFAPLLYAPERTVTGLSLLCAGCAAQAGGFVDDSQARFEARTVYFNRDFRDGHSNSGFIPSSGHGASARSVPCYQWRPDQGPWQQCRGQGMGARHRAQVPGAKRHVQGCQCPLAQRHLPQ